MKLKDYTMVGIAALSLSAALAVHQTTAHAIASEWMTTHKVTFTENVTVDVYKIAYPEYKSHIIKHITIKRGSHYKLDHPGTNFPWMLMSGKYNSNGKYAYVPHKSDTDGSWFESGYHKLASNYKSFHGYRIEGRKSLYTYNTFYDKASHSTLSDYKPTQTSKIIFEYGSHVYPTHHVWSRIWDNYHKETDYRYANGAWHQDSPTVTIPSD